MLPGADVGAAGVLKLRQGPHLDFENLERIEYGHRNSVSALVRQMTADPGPQHLIGLPDINGFTVIIEERVDAPFVVSDLWRLSRPVVKRGIEKLS